MPVIKEILMTELLSKLEASLDQMKAWRHHLHQNPELSFQESETSKFMPSSCDRGATTSKKELGSMASSLR